MQKRIRLAIQKKGRLHDDTIRLLKESDFSITSSNRYLLKVNNFPVDIILVRDDDVPYVVASGTCNWGIVGSDVYEELSLDDNDLKNKTVIDSNLHFGACRLSIAVPASFNYNGVQDLNGKKIATSYPELLRKFLKENQVTSTIIPMHGSVEVAPKIKVADGICDLVSSGATLQENNLIEKEQIFKSNAILIRNQEDVHASELIYQEFMTRLNSVQVARDKRYIMMNVPKIKLDEILNIFPHPSTPTVVQLKDEFMVGVHVLVDNKKIWNILHLLKASDASSILVLPVEKMIV